MAMERQLKMSLSQMSKDRLAGPALIWGAFSLIFILFGSKQYVAVDGALRCLDVYYSQKLFIHQNNHLLYPVNVYFWHKFLATFGIFANGPVEYLRLTQMMNAVAAGGCLAILYCLTYAATSSRGISFGVTIGYGFSNAFFSHATNSAEPMVGLWWSFLATGAIALALKTKQRWLLFASGALFALAMATYQSVVLLSPAAAALCLTWPLTKDTPADIQKNIRMNTGALWRASLTALGGMVGVTLIYGLAYYYSGIHHIGAMIGRFFTLDGGNDIYGGITISKFATLPLGLANSIAPVLKDFTGIKAFFLQRGLDYQLVGVFSLMFVTSAFVALALYLALSARIHFMATDKATLLALMTGLVVTLSVLAYWSAFYDKLWLQPAACIFLLCGFGLRTGITDKVTFQRYLRTAGIVLIVIEATLTLTFKGIPDHFSETAYLSEAKEVAELVREQDMVVCDWDGLSTTYSTVFRNGKSIQLPALTSESGPGEALKKIQQDILQTQKEGGQVYFLNVLDISEKSWNGFLGGRLGLDYYKFDDYRKNTEIIKSFKLKNGETTLRRLRDQYRER
jgi:hypothetical protein